MVGATEDPVTVGTEDLTLVGATVGTDPTFCPG